MGGKKWRRSGKEEERVGKRGEVGQAEERETRRRGKRLNLYVL